MDVYMGLIFPSAIPFNPYGTSLCLGQELAVNQNSAMFSIISTYFGGNGSTTFNLPDLQGRVPVGAGNGVGLTPRILGIKGKGGSETTQLSISNIPTHNHAAQSTILGLGVSLSTITASATGSLPVNADASIPGTTNIPGGTAGYPGPIPDLSGGGISDNNFYGAPNGTSNMPVNVAVTVNQPTVTSKGGSVSTQIGNTGSGNAFNNMQPFLPINYLIIMMGIYPTRQ